MSGPRLPPAALQLPRGSSPPAGPGGVPSSSAKPAPRSSAGAPISQAEPSTAGRPPMIGTTEPSSPTPWPVSVRPPGGGPPGDDRNDRAVLADRLACFGEVPGILGGLGGVRLLLRRRGRLLL